MGKHEDESLCWDIFINLYYSHSYICIVIYLYSYTHTHIYIDYSPYNGHIMGMQWGYDGNIMTGDIPGR